MSSTPQSAFVYWASKNWWTLLVGPAVWFFIWWWTKDWECVTVTGNTGTVGYGLCDEFPKFLGVSAPDAKWFYGFLAAMACAGVVWARKFWKA